MSLDGMIVIMKKPPKATVFNPVSSIKGELRTTNIPVFLKWKILATDFIEIQQIDG